jgi:hypothetical protein
MIFDLPMPPPPVAFAESLVAPERLYDAQATWDPPARYDKPFPGRTVVRQLPPRQVANACRELFGARGLDIAVGLAQRGCAVHLGDQCQIISIDRPAYGTTPEAVIRHERGHCNGWPADHPR